MRVPQQPTVVLWRWRRVAHTALLCVLFRYGLRAVEQPDSDFTLARIAETVGLDDRLAARRAAPPSEFAEAMQVREKAYGQADYTPLGSVDNISAGAFYLDRVDDKHRRQYLVK